MPSRNSKGIISAVTNASTRCGSANGSRRICVRRTLRGSRAAGFPYLQFKAATELTHSAQELDELRREVLEQSDTRVIIDLSRVTRIDSAGLGQLMSCYSHLVKNRGALKMLNPAPEIKNLLDMTGLSTLIPTFHDEQEALNSFNN